MTAIGIGTIAGSRGEVKSVELHFFISQTTGQGGPSPDLRRALLEQGFKVIFN